MSKSANKLRHRTKRELIEENASFRKQIVFLRQKNVQLKKESAEKSEQQQQEIDLLQGELALVKKQSKQKIDRLKKEVSELKARLVYHDNSNSPPSQGSLQHKRRKKIRREHNASQPPKQPGQKKGHKGESCKRKIDRTVECKLNTCASCGSEELTHEFSYSKITIEVPPVKATVTDNRCFDSTCNSCGVFHKAPGAGVSGTCFEPNMLALMVMLWNGRMGIRGIAEFIQETYGIYVSPAAVNSAIHAAVKPLDGEFESIREEVQDNNVTKYIDETTMPVKNSRAYSWCSATKNAMCIVLVYGRSSASFALAFPKIKSRVVTDQFPVYKKIPDRQACWAHILRVAEFLMMGKDPPAAGHLYDELYSLHQYACDRSGPDDGDRLASELLIIIDRYDNEGGTDEMRKFATSLRNAEPNLFTFLRFDDMDSTNNLAERVQRPVAIQRKIRGHLWSDSGMHMMSVLITCIGTWKMRNKCVREMLVEHFSAHTAQQCP